MRHMGTRCTGCGEPCLATASVCPSCGTQLREVKDRSVAIILAVFFSFVTWAYTYQRNKVGFWVGLLVDVAAAVLGAVSGPAWAVLGVGVWLAAIFHSVGKSREYYLCYPNYQFE